MSVAVPFLSDSRHPGWSRDAPQVPANAAFQRGQGSGSQGSGSNKRRLDCTWGPCLSKTTHSEDRCFTKHPHLRKTKPGAPVTNPVPMALALPGVLTPRQLASLQAQIDGPSLSEGVWHVDSGAGMSITDYPAFALDVDEDGGVVIPTTPEWLWHRRLGHPGYDAMHNLNATVERYNGVLQNVARSIHLESKLTKSFWPYAFLAACYLRNRLPNQGDKTPYELFFGVLPDVSLLRVFGCPCYVTLVNGKKRNSLTKGRYLVDWWVFSGE
eukprot:gene11860-biopygen9824